MDRFKKVLAFTAVITVLLAACGGAQATTEPASQPAGAPGAAQVTIQGFAFDPAALTVTAGTTVTWSNQDSVTHTVTSDDGVWDSGGVAQGATYSRVFDQAGTFAYHCTPHKTMKGTIVVTQ